MLRNLLLVVLVWLSTIDTSLGQYWLQRGGGLTVDEGYSISTDGSGNTYVTGYYTGNADFGPNVLTSAGGTDIFVAKINSTGNYDWAVSAGGTQTDRGLSIQTDAQGNSYVTGFFNGTATFGSITLTSAGLQDVFIAKYNSAGVVQWAVSGGGTAADIGNGIDVNASGDVAVTGEFNGTATFGATSMTAQNSSTDVFITTLDGNGNFGWSQQGAGDFTDRGLDVGVDGSGNVYAVGQFSDDFTFDNTFTNTAMNVAYIAKFDDTGQEQWFRLIGGGSTNIVSAIAVSSGGDSYITGDYTGNLTLNGGTAVTLPANWANNIFVARYNTSGQVQWGTGEGSDSDITSQDIAIDGSGNSSIVGHFTCALDEYAAQYGSGTFNSVGNHDIFVSRYNNSGAWQYSRNIGGRNSDFGRGVAVDGNGRIHITGSYDDHINVPVSANFNQANLNQFDLVTCPGQNGYCGDPSYGEFATIDFNGNIDILAVNCFDPAREPYDFYNRSGGGCNRDIVPVCLNNGCPDTLTACSSVPATAEAGTCNNLGGQWQIAPLWTYNWSNAATGIGTAFLASGSHWVQRTSADGCFVTRDSFEVVITGLPPAAPVTDDKGINVNTTNPSVIDLCFPDTVTISATVPGGGNYTFHWNGPGLPMNFTGLSFTTATTGFYVATVIDSIGCSNTTIVEVIVADTLPPFELRMLLDDSLEVCQGELFNVQLWDSLTNPGILPNCLNSLPYNVTTNWYTTPMIPNGESCETFGFFFPTDTGWVTITGEVIRETPCEIDTHYVTDSIFITTLPVPVIPPFSISIFGSPWYCPGGQTLLYVTGGPNYTWSGQGYTGFGGDTILVSQTDLYTVTSSVADTNIYGCTASFSASASLNVAQKPIPQVTASDPFICPNDSVLLTATMTGASTGFFWEGPNGPIPLDTPLVWATDPGTYFVTVNDSDSCALVSNSVVLAQYTTPNLIANGDVFLCEDDSVTISVDASNASQVVWLAPLSGTGLSQTVTQPGVYECEITACGITTVAQIEVFPALVDAGITPSGPLCAGETITLSGATGMASYEWGPTMDTTSSISVSQPGTYTLTASDSTGCEASDTITINTIVVAPSISLVGDTTFCEGDSVQLVAAPGLTNYSWQPGNDTTLSLQVFNSGTYFVSAQDTNGCVGISNSITLNTAPTTIDVALLGDTTFCDDDTVFLQAQTPGLVSYNWSPGSLTGQTVAVTQAGTYVVTTTDIFGCEAISDPITVFTEQNNTVTPTTSPDQLICQGAPTQITASTSGPGTLTWYLLNSSLPLGTGPVYTPTSTASTQTYVVFAEEGVCQSGGNPVTVEVYDCNITNLPNVFSPNGDGLNDYFIPDLRGITCYNCKIYNRWGQLLYEIQTLGQGWDGTAAMSGKPVSEGTYYYVIEYCKFDETIQQLTGYIQLMRN